MPRVREIWRIRRKFKKQRGKGMRLTATGRLMIIKLYPHYSVSEIARYVGVDKSTVWKVWADAGRPATKDLDQVPWIPSKYRGQELREEIIYLKSFGLSVAQIAERLDITSQTTYVICAELGLNAQQDEREN